MTLDLTCQACDATFELELSDLVDEPVVVCPSCEARAPRSAVDGVTGALDDLFAQLAVLRRKFSVSLEIDTDDLPAQYEREVARSREEDADEEGEDWDGDGDADEDEEEAAAAEDEDDR